MSLAAEMSLSLKFGKIKMKKKQFEAFCKKLLTALPGFSCKGWLLYEQPVGNILKGFCCDDSSFDSEIFTVNVFVLPLYIPQKFLGFLFGRRLWDLMESEIWWNIHDPELKNKLLLNIQQNGIPFLSQVNTPLDMASFADSTPRNQNQNCLEAAAYSWVLAKEVTKARQVLDRLFSSIDPTIEWHLVIRDRAKIISDKLDNSLDDAVQKLAEWEQQSRVNLGLS